MPKKTKSYQGWLTPKLTDPERAARFLNAALEDSEAMFLKALRKVASSQALPMSEIADACGISRESLYRMLSETGNPTSENRRAILAAMGLKSIVVPIEKPRVTRDARSESSKNATAAGSKLRDNIASTRSERLESVLAAVGLSFSGAPLRKSPTRALQNLASAGYFEKVLLQTGASH